jgi:acyl-CoA thioester hydrolase
MFAPQPEPTRTEVLYTHPVRVYWEDTDAGGVVFYANYLKFFERARTEWLRHLGLGQQALRDSTGAIFVVTDTQVRYHLPARLDDLLHITVQLRARGAASLHITQQALRLPAGVAAAPSTAAPPALLAQGDIRIGCVDSHTFKPRRVPLEVTALLAQPGPAPTKAETA